MQTSHPAVNKAILRAVLLLPVFMPRYSIIKWGFVYEFIIKFKTVGQ